MRELNITEIETVSGGCAAVTSWTSCSTGGWWPSFSWGSSCASHTTPSCTPPAAPSGNCKPPAAPSGNCSSNTSSSSSCGTWTPSTSCSGSTGSFQSILNGIIHGSDYTGVPSSSSSSSCGC